MAAAARNQFEIVEKDGLPGYTVPGMYISYHYTENMYMNEIIMHIDYPMCVIFPLDDTRVKIVYAYPIDISLRTRVKYERFPYIKVGEMLYLDHHAIINTLAQRIGGDKSLTDNDRHNYWSMGAFGKILSSRNKFKLPDLHLLDEMPSDGHILTIIREYSRICQANKVPMSEKTMRKYVASILPDFPSLRTLAINVRLQYGPLSPSERGLLGPARADKYDSLYSNFTRRDE